MLVIAVIVAVTIGITRHKLDNIVTYTYYSAYSLLRTATSQMLVDYDPNDERYQAKVENSSILAKARMFFESNFGVLAAAAIISSGGISTDFDTSSSVDSSYSCGIVNDIRSCQDNGCWWCMAEKKCVPSSSDCNTSTNTGSSGTDVSLTPVPACGAVQEHLSGKYFPLFFFVNILFFRLQVAS